MAELVKDSFNDLGIKANDIIYDNYQIMNILSFESIDVILGYGKIYRMVTFGEHNIPDGEKMNIINYICNNLSDDEIVKEIENNI